MLGILYILLGTLLGRMLCRECLRSLDAVTEQTKLPGFLVKLPAWYLTGNLLMTWLVYLVSYVFCEKQTPMFYGNLVVIPLVFLLVLGYEAVQIKKNRDRVTGQELAAFFDGRTETKNGNLLPLLFVIVAAGLVTYLMFLTFHCKDGSTYVGYSVFSDFAPHLGMIRSFSKSNNFPTQYAHFAGEDIRYHFMFQFMVGNLEYLGLRIDWAFNLPSIFGMVSVYMLLFVLAVRITGSRLCGYLTVLLFTFRSSFTVFRYMAEQSKGTVIEALKNNTEFLGYTQNENWGLWNLNVYCNQRHLAFALAFLILAVLLFYPYAEKAGERMKKIPHEKNLFSYAVRMGKAAFFSKTSFAVYDLRFSVAMGIFLGALAFWNGSVLIATLSILFFMAAVSEYRLDYLVTAVIALVLSLLQSALFVNGSAVEPAYYFGFLAENKTFWGVIVFIIELTGIVLVTAAAGACLQKGIRRYMLIPFLAPFVLAFTLSLTVDITVNHKWIMMSLMLVSIYAAFLLTRLAESGDWLKRLVALALCIVLTATGIYDFTIVIKRNQNYLVFSEDDPVTNWIIENATCEDIFLTPYYSLNNVVMGGAMLYYGWPYYAWSAGYDTYARDREVRRMYEASSSEELKELIEKNSIRYIIIDHDCRTSDEYDVREDVIENTYETVFECDTGKWQVRIFDTKLEK